MNRLRPSQSGSISLESLIFLIVVGVGIYVAVMMTAPLIRFYQVQELFRNEVVKLKTISQDDVRGEIKFKLNEIEVAIPDEEIIIVFEEGKPARIEATYSADVDFVGLYKYTYTFHPVGEAPKSAGYN